MAEIGFYHLTRTQASAALPPLLGRTLGAGQRAVVKCAGPAQVAELDAALWQCTDPDWLPHGTRAMGFGALQPIWLTHEDDRPNNAAFLFLLDGARGDLAAYSRVFTLFDGTDAAAVAQARDYWKLCRGEGHVLTYWQQTAKGWEKK